jgi:hypothetical protein
VLNNIEKSVRNVLSEPDDLLQMTVRHVLTLEPGRYEGTDSWGLHVASTLKQDGDGSPENLRTLVQAADRVEPLLKVGLSFLQCASVQLHMCGERGAERMSNDGRCQLNAASGRLRGEAAVNNIAQARIDVVWR